MSAADLELQTGAPVLLERGRHAISGLSDGSWVITRAGPICETCQSCGCGEQQEPIQVPPMIVKLITMDPDKRAKLNPFHLMRQLAGGKAEEGS